jgi:large subunit ribosomal protein L30e
LVDANKEIKKVMESEKVVYGKEQTIKYLKQANIKTVYISSNCPAETKEDIKYYALLGNVAVIELKENNEELGLVCKKPFTISVLSVLKKV